MHSSSIKPCLCQPQCFAVLVACPAPTPTHKGFPEGPPTLDLTVTPAPRADAFIQPQTLPLLLASMFCCACCLPSPFNFTPTHKGFPEGPPTSHSEQKPDITQRAEARHRGWGGVGWGWMGWGRGGVGWGPAPWYCPLPFLLERANSNKVRALQPTAAATEHKIDLRWCGARERKTHVKDTCMRKKNWWQFHCSVASSAFSSVFRHMIPTSRTRLCIIGRLGSFNTFHLKSWRSGLRLCGKSWRRSGLRLCGESWRSGLRLCDNFLDLVQDILHELVNLAFFSKNVACFNKRLCHLAFNVIQTVGDCLQSWTAILR